MHLYDFFFFFFGFILKYMEATLLKMQLIIKCCGLTSCRVCVCVCVQYSRLSKQYGMEIYLKKEHLHYTGSVKERGVFYLLTSLTQVGDLNSGRERAKEKQRERDIERNREWKTVMESRRRVEQRGSE